MLNWMKKLFAKKKPEEKASVSQEDKKTKEQAKCNIEEFARLFDNDDTFVSRQFLCGKLQCCIAFMNGMVNSEIIDLHIIHPMMQATPPEEGDLAQWLTETVISVNESTHHTELSDMVDYIVIGDTLLFVEGIEGAFSFNTKLWLTRAVVEPENEKVIKGPREGFNESLIVNTTMIRRRLRTNDLKFSFRKLGRRTKSTICIIYLQELVNQSVLDELNSRLDKIDIDGVLGTNYIEEQIVDSPWSLFNTLGNTERPDIVAAKLLEGRVALMIDGTPTAVILPSLFIEYFQTNEDYYDNYKMATINRIIRILGFILTITVPAIYLSLVTIHQEMVPTSLLQTINSARQAVPFPSIVEALLMLLAFEVLREAGARLPSFLGQSLSIVGGLVIGQAAVQARIISAPIVIVVAFTGITGLLVPRLSSATLILRVLFLIASSFVGLYGLMLGLIGLLIHLFGMRSFGVPYMMGTMPMNLQDLKDTLIRAPWWYMIMRPRSISVKDSVRQAGKKI
jgi:spore germination protein KA